MNVARSTFVRRGYLLTALAVAVLLAGFSGTAWAQSVSISSSSSTLPESASDDPATPARVTVTITRSGRDTITTTDEADSPVRTVNEIFVPGQAHLNIRAEYNGEPVSTANGGSAFTVAVKEGMGNGVMAGSLVGGVATLGFTDGDDTDEKADKKITLLFGAAPDDGDWDDEKLVLTVTPGPALTARLEDLDPDARALTFKPARTFTIKDDDPTPKLKFGKTEIQLAKGNDQTVTVEMGVGARGEAMLPTGSPSIAMTLEGLNGGGGGRGDSKDRVLLSVSPADAVGPFDEADRGIISITRAIDGVSTGDLEPDGQGGYIVGTIMQAAAGDVIELTITAKEASGFRDESVTLMLMEGRTEDRIAGDGGPIDDADPATVTVLSGEETPTVTFSTDSIDIDEGDSETVHLLAGGMQGDEVGAVTVAVRGDALISLEQNGSPIGGTVSFGGNANAALTVVSHSDPSLEDGEEKTATVSITNASGALIGDPNTVTVTVVGSTAVPVLPLFAQLLLALLLMVGGARLYRRRQG